MEMGVFTVQSPRPLELKYTVESDVGIVVPLGPPGVKDQFDVLSQFDPDAEIQYSFTEVLLSSLK